jgi:hypothetical protein
MELNRWRQIGIVLSIIWATVAWFYARHVDLDIHSDVLNAELTRCVGLSSEKEQSDCIKRAREDFVESFQADWLYILALALAPIPVGWLIAYGVVALTRRNRMVVDSPHDPQR